MTIFVRPPVIDCVVLVLDIVSRKLRSKPLSKIWQTNLVFQLETTKSLNRCVLNIDESRSYHWSRRLISGNVHNHRSIVTRMIDMQEQLKEVSKKIAIMLYVKTNGHIIEKTALVVTYHSVVQYFICLGYAQLRLV